MSVLLTAVKTKKKQHPPKSAAGRRGSASLSRVLARQQTAAAVNIPPASSSSTAVWYWQQGDTMTTVILPRESLQLWCNGLSFNAASLLSVGDFEFDIYEASTGRSLEARLLAIRDCGGLTFSLYVDGKFIPEHATGAGRK